MIISVPEAGTDLDLDGAADVLHGGDARDGEGDSAPHQVRHHCEEQVNLDIYFICELSKQDWKSDRSAKLKSGSKIHESMNAGFELNN